MKKLFILCAVLLVMSGCGENDNTKMLSCTNTDVNDLSGITTKTRYDFKYMDDEIKYVTITYKYTQGEANMNNDAGNARNGNNTRNNTNDVDGINADTDGLDENNNTANNDGSVSSDEIVDGVVGDAIDETVDTVTDTILDIAGIRTNFENQFSAYDGMEGFSYDVDEENDNEYTVVYKIDMDKISDANLATFNIDRNFKNSRTAYEDSGYTCK